MSHGLANPNPNPDGSSSCQKTCLTQTLTLTLPLTPIVAGDVLSGDNNNYNYNYNHNQKNQNQKPIVAGDVPRVAVTVWMFTHPIPVRPQRGALFSIDQCTCRTRMSVHIRVSHILAMFDPAPGL